MAASEIHLAVVDGGAGAALGRGEWTEALDALLAQRQLTPVDLDMLARTAYGAGEVALAIGASGSLYAYRRAAGDDAAAAAAAIAVFLMSEIATIYRSRALAAAASAAHGQIAVGDGDAESAVRWAEDALAGWSEVDSPYECASARLVLAAAHRLAGRVDRAALEERTAWTTLDRIGARTAVPPPREPLPDRGRCVFRLDGDTRTVVFAGRGVLLRDLKGMHHLARLLGAPDREFHALDLTAGEGGVAARPDGNDAGPVLDGQARCLQAASRRDRRGPGRGSRPRRRRARGAGPGGPRPPGPGTGRSLRPRWPAPGHGLCLGARTSERHALAALFDRPDRPAPRPARRSPGPERAHGYVLLLRPRSPDGAPLGTVTGTRPVRAPGRIRTCDRRIRSPVLYPLSYGRSVADHRIARSGGSEERAGRRPQGWGGSTDAP